MKIDKVLEAHGIGIVQLNPPTPTTGIVTNGLVGYWNSKQGVNGSTWENIAPATKGQYNAVIEGATVTPEGMMFNRTTDHVQIPIPNEMKVVTNATFEMRIRSYGEFNGGYADIVNQDGRELVWIGAWELVLSGIFDLDKWVDHKWIPIDNTRRLIYLTITADLINGRITAYMYDPVVDDSDVDSYSTRVGTMADGDFIWLSRTQTPHSGVLDGIRMYNRVLTAEEITQNRAIGNELGLPTEPISDVLFYDNFSESTLGQDWSFLNGSFSVYEGYIASTSANSRAIVTTVAVADNISISADLIVSASEGLTVRAIDSSNHIRVVLERTDRLVVAAYVNGVGTELSAVSFSAPTTMVNLKVELRGNQITVFVDGVQKIQTTSSQFLTATQHGVHSWTDNASRGRFYNFEIKSL